MKSEPVDLVLVNGMGMDASAAGRGCNRNSFEFGDGLFLLASYSPSVLLLINHRRPNRKPSMKTFWITLTLALSIAFRTGSVWSAESLPGTQPLTTEGDITSQLVSGVDTFLLREIDESVERRERFWHRDFSSPEAYSQSIETHRARLAHLLGVRDRRASNTTPELVATVDEPALVGIGVGYEIYAIRWAAFGDVHGEGLLLKPTGRAAVGDVIAVPDAEIGRAHV